jgi:probable F420-dependent oxidoreductase
VKFILGYPEKNGIDGDLLDSGSVSDLAAAAERAGWSGFALTEHPVPGAKWLAHGGHQTLDPFVGLGFAGAVTERIRLLTYLAVAPYRNPFLLAKAAATLDRLSGGRFVLGIGTGYHKAEFFALGVDFEERNDLFDEVLDVLPLAWSGEPFSYRGRHFDARDVISKPVPAQQPIPIWIGGNSKLTRRRVAQRAQGWMPFPVTGEMARTTRTPVLDSIDTLRTQIADLREQAGSRAGDIEVAFAYHDPGIHEPTSDVERHRDAFAEMADAGIDWVAVTAQPGEPARLLDFAQAFGATYTS